MYLPLNQLTYLNFLNANEMLSLFGLDVSATETKNTTRVFTETIILTLILYWLFTRLKYNIKQGFFVSWTLF